MKKSLPKVERVAILLPQEQVAVTAVYVGWISCFMENLKLGRVATSPEAKHHTLFKFALVNQYAKWVANSSYEFLQMQYSCRFLAQICN